MSELKQFISGTSTSLSSTFKVVPPTVPATLSSGSVIEVAKVSVKPYPSWKGHEKHIFRKAIVSFERGADPLQRHQTLPPVAALIFLNMILSQRQCLYFPVSRHCFYFVLMALSASLFFIPLNSPNFAQMPMTILFQSQGTETKIVGLSSRRSSFSSKTFPWKNPIIPPLARREVSTILSKEWARGR